MRSYIPLHPSAEINKAIIEEVSIMNVDKFNFKKTFKNTCMEAVETFGVISQLDQAQEEAAELIAAISGYKRALESRDIERIRLTKEKVQFELADNAIMSKQLKLILDLSKQDFRNKISVKLKKLANYIATGTK